MLDGKRDIRLLSTTGCSGGNKLSNVTSFIIMHSWEVLTSSNKNNHAHFSWEKK